MEPAWILSLFSWLNSVCCYVIHYFKRISLWHWKESLGSRKLQSSKQWQCYSIRRTFRKVMDWWKIYISEETLEFWIHISSSIFTFWYNKLYWSYVGFRWKPNFFWHPNFKYGLGYYWIVFSKAKTVYSWEKSRS